MSAKIGVMLLNLGGPDKLEDVYPFLYNLFSDPDLIRIPLPWLQKPLAAFIAAKRTPISQQNYAAIGGGSPLRQITQEQADALENTLQRLGVNAKVYVAMRYWQPDTAAALRQIKQDQITKLVVLPLYPQFSISTTGSSLKHLNYLWQQDPAFANMEKIEIRSWCDRPGYMRAMADLIHQKLKTSSPDTYIFFSAHGVPKKYVTAYGDPYQLEIENCVDGIMQCLRREFGCHHPHLLAYQSRVGPVEWLQPYTEEAIAKLAKRGINHLLVVPISFVSEHIETLQEIDIEYREVAESLGIEHFDRVPALNSNPAFIKDLANLVLESLGQELAVAV